jgi:hypothetical protein
VIRHIASPGSALTDVRAAFAGGNLAVQAVGTVRSLDGRTCHGAGLNRDKKAFDWDWRRLADSAYTSGITRQRFRCRSRRKITEAEYPTSSAMHVTIHGRVAVRVDDRR